MRVWVGFALAAAMVFGGSAAAAARLQTANNLKQLGVGVVLFELDYGTPAMPTFDETEDGISGKLKVRKTGCVGEDCVVELTYFTLSAGGGLAVADPAGTVLFSAFGEQLFTGSTARPEFRLGDFMFDTDRNGGAIDGRLSVAEAVPEPAGWALMVTGFGLTGAVARRRARALPA